MAKKKKVPKKKPKPKVRVKPKPKAENKPPFRHMLDRIDQFLAQHAYDTQGRKLWDVLSATRGPDMPGSFGVKDATTVHVRRKAFPLTAEKGPDIGASFTTYDVVRKPKSSSDHFNRHIEDAYLALGIKPKD
jgi:hypothetical protein